MLKEEIENYYFKIFNETPLWIKKISSDGSSRQYYRCFSLTKPAIFAYNSNREENLAFLDYSRQLKQHGINVPEIYASDIDKGISLQQDLGDMTLLNYINEHTQKDIDKIYYKVLEYLPRIQTMKYFLYKNAYPRKAFDRQSIQWDLNYFKYYFLRLAHIPFNEQGIERDFTTLINYLLDTRHDYFLYRDFQSRNIMIFENKLYFIDFQGGRKGALQYDLASLLYDAKACISPQTREKYFKKYIREIKKYTAINVQDFTRRFYAYAYVRIMQAMGAYGYRGYFEKKQSFLKSVPLALENLKYLEENVSLSIDIPHLHDAFKKMLSSERLKNLAYQNKKLNITIKSFSYKKAIPMDISGNGGGYIFDCRALPNPGRIEKYKRYTGLDACVKEYLDGFEEMDFFVEHVMCLINQTINNYLKRGFSNLSVYFGCTGGRHRSVYCADRIARILRQNTDLNVFVQHVEQNL